MNKCVKCGDKFYLEYEHGELLSDKLCYYCFEDGVEEFEERKRERIARQNEY